VDMLSEVLGKCWIYIETRERGEVRDVKSGTLDLVGFGGLRFVVWGGVFLWEGGGCSSS